MTGTPENTILSAVREALLRDPISIAYRHGGVLLNHMVLVGEVGRQAHRHLTTVYDPTTLRCVHVGQARTRSR